MASLPKPVFMPNTPFQEGAHAAAKKSAPFHGGAAPRRLDLEFDGMAEPAWILTIRGLS